MEPFLRGEPQLLVPEGWAGEQGQKVRVFGAQRCVASQRQQETSKKVSDAVKVGRAGRLARQQGLQRVNDLDVLNVVIGGKISGTIKISSIDTTILKQALFGAKAAVAAAEF